LIRAAKNEDLEEDIEKARRETRKLSRHLLDKMFEECNIDIIVAPGDCGICIYGAAAGKFKRTPILIFPDPAFRISHGGCATWAAQVQRTSIRYICHGKGEPRGPFVEFLELLRELFTRKTTARANYVSK
jgi:hypothetical protein